jgi:hypothetical protein
VGLVILLVAAVMLFVYYAGRSSEAVSVEVPPESPDEIARKKRDRLVYELTVLDGDGVYVAAMLIRAGEAEYAEASKACNEWMIRCHTFIKKEIHPGKAEAFIAIRVPPLAVHYNILNPDRNPYKWDQKQQQFHRVEIYRQRLIALMAEL